MERCNRIIINVLLLVSLLFPTSLNGEISTKLEVVQTMIIALIFLLFFLNNRKSLNIKIFISVLVLNFSILFFTIISPFSDYTFGSYFSYLLISLMLMLQLKNQRLLKKEIVFFQILNMFMLVLAILIISKNASIGSFLTNYYSAGYDILVQRMMQSGKPVVTFGTHSIAAMFYYLFFFMNIKEYEVSKSKKSLLLALLNIVAMFFLNSVTSTLFVIISIIQTFLLTAIKKKYISFILMSALILIVFVLNWQTIAIEIGNVFNRDAHGFAGRYSTQGVLANNIEFILNHPLRGIGLSYDSSLYYTDSGIVVNLLRGSVFLVISIYYGFYKMIRTNTKSKKNAIYLFAVFIAFELGYSFLTYKRFIAFLPYVIIFLNSINSNKKN